MFRKNDNLDGLSFEQEFVDEFVAEEVVEEPEIEFEEIVEEEIPEEVKAVESCYIINGNLNLRKEASKDSDIVKVLPLGLVLEVKEKDGDWTKVSDGIDEGWVMTEFVKFGE